MRLYWIQVSAVTNKDIMKYCFKVTVRTLACLMLTTYSVVLVCMKLWSLDYFLRVKIKQRTSMSSVRYDTDYS